MWALSLSLGRASSSVTSEGAVQAGTRAQMAQATEAGAEVPQAPGCRRLLPAR